MSKTVLEITGYWKEYYNEVFDKSQSWHGYLLVASDGTFEGIVVEEGQLVDSYLLGTVVHLKGIKFMKFSSLKYDPLSFKGVSDGNKIVGTFGYLSEISGFHEKGYCQINLVNLGIQPELQSELEERIDTFRANADFMTRVLIGNVAESLSNTATDFLNELERDTFVMMKKYGFIPKRLELKNRKFYLVT